MTYNYSGWYYKHLNEENGLRWLDGKQAQDCVLALRAAVDTLGTVRHPDYWKSTPGNAGRALALLLKWAEANPEAVFKVS